VRRLLLASLCLTLLAPLGLCERTIALDLGTFNIRMFPEVGTDLEAVARAIAELDADAFAVQEIVEPAVFRAVLIRAGALTGRRYGVVLEPAHCPRRSGAIHVGVVHDLDVLTLVESRMLGDFTCPKGQPAGMLALLQARDGRRLALASVHFSAGDAGKTRDERMAQWAWLIDELPELHAELDAPVIVGGDFNSTGYLGENDPERRFIDALVDHHALQLPTGALACSMYWKRKGHYPVSLLDHVLAPRELAFGRPEALGMCAELACVPQDEPPVAWETVSDHCPVRVPLKF
jgi:endonuclease/exonuclease/phosphatase family metal-dependent hydrolase